MNKNFDDWNMVKQSLDSEHKPPLFNEGQVWWCSVGLNVGFETYGKNKLFNRPVIIIKKYSRFTFFGLPMTSRQKEHKSYYPFYFNGVHGSILIQQGRSFDSRRLGERIGQIPSDQLEIIKKALKDNL